MKTVELFSGTKSFSKVMQVFGHSTLTFDNDLSLEPDVCGDILSWPFEEKGVDILWASPPCQGFSVKVIDCDCPKCGCSTENKVAREYGKFCVYIQVAL